MVSVRALKQGRGDCTEYAALFVAAARAEGIPARMNTVMSMRKDGLAKYDDHNNAEVYLEGRWLPVELMFGVKKLGQLTDDEVVMRLGYPGYALPWSNYKVARDRSRDLQIRMVDHHWRRL